MVEQELPSRSAFPFDVQRLDVLDNWSIGRTRVLEGLTKKLTVKSCKANASVASVFPLLDAPLKLKALPNLPSSHLVPLSSASWPFPVKSSALSPVPSSNSHIAVADSRSTLA